MFDPLLALSTDAERLAAVRRTALLDTPAEEAFDRLTRLAARLLEAPVALCALLDAKRFFFKSCYGLPLAPDTPRERSTRGTFCQYAIAQRSPLVIADARTHPLFHDHPAVTELGIRGYLGVPLLTSSGHGLGIFCIFDTQPRTWSDEQVRLASDLAAAAVTELELRTAVREAEQARSEAQRLYSQAAESERRKDEFLAMLGHELRNPLAPVLTSVHLLRAQHGAPGIVERTCAVIERQVHHLTHLVDDLLDLSRLTLGKITLRREPVTLAQVLARVVELAAPLCRERRHQLVYAAPADPLRVDGDPVRLEQVFSNLLHNAVKYTPEGGRIELSVVPRDGQVQVSVRDNGEGLAPDLLPRLFQPFVQGERTQAHAQGGLGVGLSLVRSLVTLHGGTVEARSEGEGRGAEFVVTLPLLPLPAAEAGHPAAPGTEAAPARLRILIADDNRDAAEMLALLLDAWGHEVRVTFSGEAALQVASGFCPELVLLDLGMPGLDGFEVARRLREHARLVDTCIVAVSGYGQESDRRRTREAGFDHHLVKPVPEAALQQLLRGLAHGRPATQEGSALPARAPAPALERRS